MANDFDISLSYKETRCIFASDFEKRYVTWLLEKHSGNISAAARSARMDRKYLRDLAKRNGVCVRYRKRRDPTRLTFEVALLCHGCRRTYEATAVDALTAAKVVLWYFTPSGKYNVTVTCTETGSSNDFLVDRPDGEPRNWEFTMERNWIRIKGKTADEVATEIYDKKPNLLIPNIGLLSLIDYLDILIWDSGLKERPDRDAAIQLLKPLAQKLIDQG